MSDQHQDFDQAVPVDYEGKPAIIDSVERLPVVGREESCQIIKEYFDYLESVPIHKQSQGDIELLSTLLTEISGFIHSEKGRFECDGYMRMLNRLTAIYAKGVQTEDNRAFTRTAVNYADIMNTVSQYYTGYDYSESISLMLHYMDKLFSYREESWLDVFEHILAMPESTQIMQLLKEQHLQEIQNWVEEGVDNLFAIWEEQLEVIHNLSEEIYQMDKQILKTSRQLRRKTSRLPVANVVYLEDIRSRHQLDQLRNKRMELDAVRDGKLELSSLLDDNIQEFGNRLTEIRRSTQVQLAWSNTPKT
jgi:hypothetical protein